MKKIVPVVASAALLAVVLAVAEPRFLSAYNLQNLARLIAFLGLLALGQGIVIIAGGIDLSVGAVVGLSALLIAMLAGPVALPAGLAAIVPSPPLGIATSVVMVIALMVGLGAIQGGMITSGVL